MASQNIFQKINANFSIFFDPSPFLECHYIKNCKMIIGVFVLRKKNIGSWQNETLINLKLILFDEKV